MIDETKYNLEVTKEGNFFLTFLSGPAKDFKVCITHLDDTTNGEEESFLLIDFHVTEFPEGITEYDGNMLNNEVRQAFHEFLQQLVEILEETEGKAD